MIKHLITLAAHASIYFTFIQYTNLFVAIVAWSYIGLITLTLTVIMFLFIISVIIKHNLIRKMDHSASRKLLSPIYYIYYIAVLFTLMMVYYINQHWILMALYIGQLITFIFIRNEAVYQQKLKDNSTFFNQ